MLHPALSLLTTSGNGFLERQHPEEYAQRTNVVVSGDRPIVFAPVDVDAELERIQKGLELNGERPALPKESRSA